MCIPRESNNILNGSIDDFKEVCPEIIIHNGILDPSEFSNDPERKRLVIFDDLYSMVCEDSRMCLFFTFSARKTSTSTISNFIAL